MLIQVAKNCQNDASTGDVRGETSHAGGFQESDARGFSHGRVMAAANVVTIEGDPLPQLFKCHRSAYGARVRYRTDAVDFSPTLLCIKRGRGVGLGALGFP